MERAEIRVLDSYTVHIGQGMLKEAGKIVSEVVPPCRAVVVTDSNIPPEYVQTLEKSLEEKGFEINIFTIPAGETSKCIEKFIEIQNFAAENHLCRSDIMIALGGGVVGDLTGFCAATYMRGIKYIQVPTTLLAAVDSSVGGKCAIDLEKGKNLIGAFCQPSAVICDVDTLKTLKEEFITDGMAEIIKYAHINQPELFEILEKTQDLTQKIKNGTDGKTAIDVISKCVKLKADIVQKDRFDLGERQLLNFGHTVGHAIEAASNFKISHGHSVAAGMCIMARTAQKAGLCSRQTAQKIEHLNKKYQLPTATDIPLETLWELIKNDKKNATDGLTVVFPTEHSLCGLHKLTHQKFKELLSAGLEK